MHATPYYWVGKSAALNYFTGVPFGLDAIELAGWLEFGGGQQLWDELYAGFGLQPFHAGSSMTQAGGWFRNANTEHEDQKGMYHRIRGLAGNMVRPPGAAVTGTPRGESLPSG